MIECGRNDWLIHVNEQRNTECLLYGKRYFCHWNEFNTKIETKVFRNKCINGNLFSFDLLKSQGIVTDTLIDWLIPFHLAEQYADYLSNSNENSMANTLICNCSANYVGTNCDYKIVQRTQDVKNLIKAQRGTKFAEYETLTSLIDQMPCQGAYPHIEWRQICDGIVQCEDAIDEIDCHLLEFHQCAEDEYQCRNGMCIPQDFLFDGEFDCLDLSDEQDIPELIRTFDACFEVSDFECDERLCAKNQISCGDGQCVHWSALFYREKGCRNQRHEAFRCDLTNHSQLAALKLNGICRQTTLPIENLTNESSCLTSFRYFLMVDRWQNASRTIPMSMNNVLRYCPEKIQYPNHSILYPGLRTFYNRTQFEIIFNKMDGFMTNVSFQPHLYCFNPKVGCNHYNSTSDENEENCFDADQFEDMILRYPFFSPFEILCQIIKKPLSQPAYECQNTTHRIAKRRVNDGYIDCLYEDDEYNDLGILTSSSLYRYQCESISNPEQYVSFNLLGNGQYDCRDGSDEMSSTVNWLLLKCDAPDAYACWIFQGGINRVNSVQLPYHRHCDTHWDTMNGKDEKECSDWTCDVNEYQCQRTGQCLDRKYHCDGGWDCSDGEDEFQNCSFKSRRWSRETVICNLTNEFYCVTRLNSSERPCISTTQIGDGHIDCLGGRDERNVFMCNDRQMLGDRFICDNQTKCLNYTSLCNGISDCFDQTDELICSWNRKNCSAGQYACYNSKTVCVDNRCFSKSECTDGSHWYWCPNMLPPFEQTYRKNKQVTIASQREKFCSKLNPMPRIAYVPSSIPVPLLFNNTGFCNRGYYLISNNDSNLACFCPPSYYGTRCQYDQRRVHILVRFDRWYRIDVPVIMNVLVALVHNNSQIVDHQYLYDISNEQPRKHQIYLLYPRPKSIGTFSVRFEAYHSTQLLGLWEYPISPLDFLPVFLLAKTLHFPSRVPPDRCPTNLCLHQGTCFIANNQKYVCFCQRGWQGRHCDLRVNHTKCASHSLVRSERVCICPYGYLYPHCYIQNKKCETISTCRQDGTCYLLSHQPPNAHLCICNRYECTRKTLLLSLYRQNSTSLPWVLQLLKVSSDYLTIAQRILIHPSTNLSAVRDMKMYDAGNGKEIVPEIALLFTFEPLQFRVNALISSIFTSCSNTSRNLTFDLDIQPTRCQRLDQKKYFSIKNLSKICETLIHESCYLWKNYLCYCQSSSNEKHNCIYYDERQAPCSHCYNQGYCVQGDLHNRSDFLCVCPRCATGDLCQNTPGKFSISFEYLFTQTRWGLYHFLLPSLFLLCAIILNNLCLITFIHHQARQTGTGIYLLIISVLNQMIFINLLLCVFYLHLLEQTVSHELVNRFLCKILPYSMNCLYFTTLWLMAFITVDRAVAANFPKYFRHFRKPGIVIFFIILTTSMVFISMYPQIKLYKLVVHPNRHYFSCIREIKVDENQYPHYIHLAHQISPFITNLIAALLIILAISRSKARAHHLSNRYSFQKQMGKRKDLVIGPIICFITEVPQVALTFLDSCNYHSNISFLNFFLIAYYISFVPQLALFLLYVLPSPLYKHLLMKETFVGKQILSKI